MGLIGDLIGMFVGNGRNVIRETAEVFRPNAEADAMRDAARSAAALSQFAAEFTIERRGWFDRFVDGLNRLPRPMLALGTLCLFAAAMIDPIWFAERMQGIALVPEPLWWLMGAIVSFYFGARHQAKANDLQRSLAATLALAPEVVTGARDLRKLDAAAPVDRGIASEDEPDHTRNAALDDWRKIIGGRTS